MMKYILAILLLITTAHAADRLISADGDRLISSDGHVLYSTGGADVVWYANYYQSPATSGDTVNSSDTAGSAGDALIAAIGASGDLILQYDADTWYVFSDGIISGAAVLSMSEFNGIPLYIVAGSVKNILVNAESIYNDSTGDMVNNIGYNPTGTALVLDASPTITTSLFSDADPGSGYTDGGNNLWASNPRWQNADNGDFRLRAYSPARRTGTNYGQTTDITGRTVLNYNMGHYDQWLPGSALWEIVLKRN